MEPTADDLDGYDDATVYEDGTVVRVSVHVAPDPDPQYIEFPGIEELYEWDEIPKPRFGPSDSGDTHD